MSPRIKLGFKDLVTEDMSDRDFYDFFKSNVTYIIEIEPYTAKVWFWKETKYRLFAREYNPLKVKNESANK